MHWNERTEKLILDRINRPPRRSALERWRRSRIYDICSLAVFVAIAIAVVVIGAWKL